jgi:putative membrane protein
MHWMHAKLLLVALLIVYHLRWALPQDFARDANTHGHVFYRWLTNCRFSYCLAR